MPGKYFQSEGEPLVPGAEVYVSVGDRGFPCGVYTARVTEVIGPAREGSNLFECIAILTDPDLHTGAAATYVGREPRGEYLILDQRQAVVKFRQLRDEAHQEVRGLKRRIEIERAAFHALIKSLVSDVAFEKLEALLERLVSKLVR